jgi:CubicO group peptidase (beta-lactamase class C family)
MARIALVRGLVIVSLCLGAAPPRPAVRVRVGLSGADYQKWVDELTRKKHRLALVSVHTVGGRPVFAGLAVPGGGTWAARHGLSNDDYHRAFDDLVGKGYRLVSVAGYLEGQTTKFAAAWVKDDQEIAWEARHDLTGAQYQSACNDAVQRGLQPVVVNGYPTAGGTRYAALFVSSGGAWFARHGMGGADYQKACTDAPRQGNRPLWASGFGEGRSSRFNLVMVQDPTKEWQARHGLNLAQFLAEAQRLGKQGYEPALVSGYAEGAQSRYLAVWTREVPGDPLPITGKAVPALAAFDQAMLRFMKERGIRGGTLAVMRNGKIVLSRGYGYARRDRSRKVQPDDPFRMASIGKPITAAAVLKLIAAGKLSHDTKVFELLGTKPPPGRTADPRLKDITVRHLLQHRGGWDRDAAPVYDPMFQPAMIARALGKKGPPEASDVISFLAGQPLQFTPGSKSVYSNFGYCVLGRVIEKVGGQSYTAYIRKEVLAPLGIKSIDLGHSLPGRRNPQEPDYSHPGTTTNVVTGQGRGPWPDGGFYLEAMDAHGGLIGSAPDLVRFLQGYLMDGRPRNGGVASGLFFGSLPGTWTMILQRRDSVNIAALFNQRSGPPGLKNEAIRNLLDRAAARVKEWP